MRLAITLAAVVVAAAPAAAKPLPKEIKSVIKNDAPFIEWRGVTVPLGDRDWKTLNDKVKKVELSDDGTSIVVTFMPCMLDDEDTLVVPLARIEAHVENNLGMQVHVKKKYDDAIAHFAIAAARDPETPVFATNLLSAQSMANKLDDADKTIDAYGAKNPAWFAWRLAVDPELANVKARPRALAIATAKKRGRAKLVDLNEEVVYSPLAGGLVGATIYDGGGMIAAASFAISDLATGRQLLRLPLSEACTEGAESPFPCDKKALAANARNAKIVAELIAALGFDRVGAKWIDFSEASEKHAAKLAKAKIDANEPPYKVAFVPGGVALYVRHGNNCMGEGLPHTLGAAAAR